MPMVRCLMAVSAASGTYRPGTLCDLTNAEIEHLEKFGAVERVALIRSQPRPNEPEAPAVEPVDEAPKSAASHPTVFPGPVTDSDGDVEPDTKPEKHNFKRPKR
jgi:hypothetical protein